MSDYKTKYHRDGTVTYWDVFTQGWVERADHVPAKYMATLPYNERERIEKHLNG